MDRSDCALRRVKKLRTGGEERLSQKRAEPAPGPPNSASRGEVGAVLVVNRRLKSIELLYENCG